MERRLGNEIVPLLVRKHHLAMLLVPKAAIEVRVPKRPRRDIPTRPARLAAQIRHERRRHPAPAVMPRVDRRRVHRRAVVREDDDLPVRFVPLDPGHLVVEPGEVGLVRPVVLVDAPVERLLEVREAGGDLAALFGRDTREERASEHGQVVRKVVSRLLEEDEPPRRGTAVGAMMDPVHPILELAHPGPRRLEARVVRLVVTQEEEDGRVPRQLGLEEGEEPGVLDVADVAEQGEVARRRVEGEVVVGRVRLEVQVGHDLEGDGGHGCLSCLYLDVI